MTLASPTTETSTVAKTMCATVTYGSYTYFIGGVTSSAALTTVVMASRTTDVIATTYAASTALPVGIFLAEAIVIKDKIFLFGGYTGTTAAPVLNNAVYCSTIGTNGLLGTWILSGYTPSNLTEFNVTVIDNILYLLGGLEFVNNASYTVSSKVYSSEISLTGYPICDWTSETNLYEPNYASVLVTTATDIYLIGGGTTTSAFTNKIYTATITDDKKLGAWSVHSVTLPVTLGYSTGAIIKNNLYLLGGMTNTTTLTNAIYSIPFTGGKTLYNSASVNMYGLNRNNYLSGMPWKQQTFNTSNPTLTTITSIAPSVSAATMGGQVVVLKNKVYVLGGITSAGVTSSAIYTATITNGVLGSWSANSTSLPVALANFGCALVGGRLYVFGGQTTAGGAPVNTVYYTVVAADGNISTAFSTASYTLPTAGMNMGVVVTEYMVYLMGGMATTSTWVSTIYCAWISSDAQLYTSHISGTLGFTSSIYGVNGVVSHIKPVVIKDYIYIFGGNSNGTATANISRYRLDGDGVIDSTSSNYATLPYATQDYDLYVTSDKIVIIGGINASGTILLTAMSIPYNSDGSLPMAVAGGAVTGATTINSVLTTSISGFGLVITSTRIYAIAGNASGFASQSVYYGTFSGGFDDYFVNAYNPLPEKVVLPDFSDTALNYQGLNAYIKY